MRTVLLVLLAATGGPLGCASADALVEGIPALDASADGGVVERSDGGCVPGPERCNRADDDCDGVSDEGLVRACGVAVGECEPGTERCEAGEWAGCDAVGGGAETCDLPGDEDCDGTPDEGCACSAGASQACGPDVGRCAPGTQRCEGGGWGACDGAVLPTPETCDGQDEDCDGVVDEGLARPCGSNAGACREGVATCAAGAWGACDGEIPASAESCEGGGDEDCDGRTDEGCACVDGLERACGSDAGRCEAGSQRCARGQWGVCEGEVAAQAEACDGDLDEDCDGAVDEGCDCVDGSRRACGSDVGVCRPGQERCRRGRWSACEGAVEPAEEACGGGRDEDCDGTTDEGFRAAIRRTTYGDLVAEHELCDGENQRFGVNCVSAVHRLCTDGCKTAGFGPVENDAERANALCMVAERVARVPWPQITALNGFCISDDPVLVTCFLAADRWCRGQGSLGGFGPVEYDANGPWLACLSADNAERRRTTYAELGQRAAPCDGDQQRFGSDCAAAVNRFCRDNGAVGGVGPVEYVDGDPVVLCVRP